MYEAFVFGDLFGIEIILLQMSTQNFLRVFLSDNIHLGGCLYTL